MVEKPEELARLILSYESDPPHVDLPNMSGSDYYPEVTESDLEDFLQQEHHGDCTNVPAVCMRCVAEQALHKADWILRQLED